MKEPLRDQLERIWLVLVIYVLLMLVILGLGPNAEAQERERIENAALAAAITYDLDPQLILAIIEVESDYNPNAIGRTHGEIGLMQLRPKFFPKADFSVIANIFMGAEYLAQLREMKAKRWGCGWFVFYNSGPNHVPQRPVTEYRYFKKVAAIYPEVCQGEGNEKV